MVRRDHASVSGLEMRLPEDDERLWKRRRAGLQPTNFGSRSRICSSRFRSCSSRTVRMFGSLFLNFVRRVFAISRARWFWLPNWGWSLIWTFMSRCRPLLSTRHSRDLRYRNEWSPIFGRELGQNLLGCLIRPPFWLNPPVNFYEDVRRLSEHGKRKWEDIAETRIKAQWLASRKRCRPGRRGDGRWSESVGKKKKKSASAGKQAERKKEKTASGSSSKTVVTIGDRVAAERADPWYAEHPGYSGRSGDGSEGTHHSHQRTVFEGAADDPPILRRKRRLPFYRARRRDRRAGVLGWSEKEEADILCRAWGDGR
ncbi:unnamed protein product [Microthlaspi erraticum]|uniref:Uncharacterized protein n=1 Tax=Microthlaspi erraticum TaxID=1685480 RepID=A0A6D2I7Q8_9BRAS|nr:unnamed protein product [Microthlaspi erraticum]